MQFAFDFGSDDLKWVRDRLRVHYGRLDPTPLREPINQLVRSSISSRTCDNVSLVAYRRLMETYRKLSALAGASAGDIQALISDVSFPEVKARHLSAALRAIEACQSNFDLTFLKRLSVPGALAWLERLPGVGRKVSASTLNFSTLNMPAFVVDTHVLRVLSRFGFVESGARTQTAYDAAMEMTYGWTARELIELHVLMKCLGQITCRANHANCSDCPIRKRCKYGAG